MATAELPRCVRARAAAQLTKAAVALSAMMIALVLRCVGLAALASLALGGVWRRRHANKHLYFKQLSIAVRHKQRARAVSGMDLRGFHITVDIMRLGIDFGTTRTTVAAVSDGRYPVVSFEVNGTFTEFLPGFASLSNHGLSYGTDAALAGGPTLRSVKARISGAMPDEILPEASSTREAVSALGLTSEYLKYVRRMLVECSNLSLRHDEPLEAMVAVPAHASTRQRYLTLEAFASAGFTVLGLVNEPTAGAVEFARHSLSALNARSPKRYVVVYDLGGGTFDTAAVSLKDRRFELIGAEGVSHLGGNQFDEIIANHVCERLGIKIGTLDAHVHTKLLENCRLAKEALSVNSRKILVEGLAELGVDEILIETSVIYDDAAPLVEETVRAMELLFNGLREHGIDPTNAREMGAIYLVGGSVQFPIVQRRLRSQFGRKIQLAPQPHASTAIGLAIAADQGAGVFVREAPTRHFGVWREGEGGREKVFDPIIEKRHGRSLNEPLLIQRVYRPTHAVGLLRFVECTSLDAVLGPSGEVTPWQNILFPYDPSLQNSAELGPYVGKRGEHLAEEIVETYEYQDTGVIRVQIENRTSGYQRRYVLGQGQTALV